MDMEDLVDLVDREILDNLPLSLIADIKKLVELSHKERTSADISKILRIGYSSIKLHFRVIYNPFMDCSSAYLYIKIGEIWVDTEIECSKLTPLIASAEVGKDYRSFIYSIKTHKIDIIKAIDDIILELFKNKELWKPHQLVIT